MQPDIHTLTSLRSLFDQVDFKQFRSFLEAVEKHEIHRAIHATDNPGVAQGRAQMIVWLRQQIETCKDAAATMEKRAYEHPPRRSSRL